MYTKLFVALAAIILVATLIPQLANASLFDMFCAATRMGVAQGPQSGSCLLQQGQQQLQQAQQGVNQNLNCPSGTQQINGQCQVINGLNSALNPLGSTAANTATCGSGFTLENGICTPTSATCTPSSTTQTQPVAVASPSSQTVTAGQLFVISGATSTGGTVLNSCVGVRFK